MGGEGKRAVAERFAVYRSSAPYGFDSRTAIAWLILTNNPIELFFGLLDISATLEGSYRGKCDTSYTLYGRIQMSMQFLKDIWNMRPM